jgi:hypothetical protein
VRLKSQQVSPGKGTPQNARVRPLRQPTTHQCCDGGRYEISVRRVDCHAVDREGSMSEPSGPVPLQAIAVLVRTYCSPMVDRALMLNSNLAEAWRCSGWMRIWLGDPGLAIEHFARAMRLSPLGRWLVDIQSGIAHAHFFLGRYDEAASWAAMALQDNPDFQAGVRISAASNAMVGRPEEAHETVVRLQRLKFHAACFESQTRSWPLSTC